MAEKLNLRKRKKFQARQTILSAAARQFELHGFANTSIAGIMQAAGLGVGTFYNYFASKEDVLLTLAKNLRAEVSEKISAADELNPSSCELLERCCVCTAKLIDENRFILPLFIRRVRNSLPNMARTTSRRILRRRAVKHHFGNGALNLSDDRLQQARHPVSRKYPPQDKNSARRHQNALTRPKHPADCGGEFFL